MPQPLLVALLSRWYIQLHLAPSRKRQESDMGGAEALRGSGALNWVALRLFLVLPTIFALGSVTCAHDQVIAERLQQYIAWVSQKTHWKTTVPPEIKVVSESELAEMAFGSPNGFMGIRPRALYSSTSRLMYLSNSLNSTDLLDQSIVVHELVHHLQVANNISLACRGQYEAQAYRLQAEWLKESGVQKPFELMKMSQATIDSFAECP